MVEALRVEQLSKHFGKVLANDGVDLDIRKGELHGLFGENGAGKSTLSACLYGSLTPDTGRIFVGAKEVRFRSPAEAIACGIGMVHQHFVLVEAMTVLENIVLGTHKSGWRLDLQTARDKLAELSVAFGLSINPDAFVRELSVGEQQWVEILKALYLDARILILDEPTAVLTPQESKRLFSVIRQMQARGMSIIIITHKMAEVMQTDRVTVLRRGRKITTVETANVTAQKLTELMIGSATPSPAAKRASRPGRVVVQTAGLRARGARGETVLDNVSFTVRSSEILGIAGVAGNGQKALLELLSGIRLPEAGSILVGDRQLEGEGPEAYMAAGVGIIPEDRFVEGLVGTFSIAENIILGSQRSPSVRSGLFIDLQKVRTRAEHARAEYAIASPDIDTPVASLSGGNAQKVILARELAQATVLLLANQPTRGLDIGVVSIVHDRLRQKRDEGCAIVLASEDLDDLFALSDRLAVMCDGRIVDIVDPLTVTIEQVGALMAGQRGAN
ncbi:ABC transporter ATP-binding protein [Pseudomonas sp. Cab53]|uniref:ABC transporter ATP-binding protein n=2 Tax=Pseudomonas TaxID=286 RepID=UPI0019F2A6C6|nr:ABC transporter ATP-binding protein [Pseudomonas cichorii]BBH32631.1 ATPase component of uncharacterized ABC-type transporter [Pseudomonas sp. St290]BBP65769.1 ABC transporter ATP-binding protein [Pseudomonas sp. Cab53]GFM84552.1 ABC transporter ATP-binding protein [Pseudomonas cichorii]